MSDSIKISIITPSYNQGQFIEATILSVLNQTYKNIEYIIVDGGSTDSTMRVVEKYKDKIDIVIHEKDKGQSDAINKGFKLATGTLVGWINSDDVLYPNCVEQLVKAYVQKNDGAIYYNRFNDRIDAKGNKILTYEKNIPDKQHLLLSNYDVIQPGSFYSNDTLKEINYVDASINYCMDLDLWLRLLNHGPIYNISNAPIAAIRVWEETKTATGKGKFLKEIRTTLLKYGGRRLSRTIIKIQWFLFKGVVKRTISR